MANTWWVVVPTADKNSSTSYKEQVDFRVQYQPGTAGERAMRAGQPFDDPTFGWIIKWKGPYATQAEAQTAQGATGSPENPVSGAVKAAQNNPSGTLPGPLTGIAAIGHFFNMLSERGTWMRIAEGTLGVALILAGVAALAEGTAVGKAIKKIPII